MGVSLPGSLVILSPKSATGGEVQSAAEGLDVAGDDLEEVTSPCSIWDTRATLTHMVAAICFWARPTCLRVWSASGVGYEHSNISVAMRFWEPKWEPTTTGTRPRQATSSHYSRS
jgi:hypothetical protein